MAVILSSSDRVRLCVYAASYRSEAICYDPSKFYLPIKEGETAIQHNVRLLEYRETLVAQFNHLKQAIKNNSKQYQPAVGTLRR